MRLVRNADNLTTSLCAVVMKSGNLNLLEPSGPLQACNGTDLPLCGLIIIIIIIFMLNFNVQGSVHRESMSLTVQQDTIIYSFIIFLQTALHVSGDNLIHHQEHTQTVITTSGTGRTVFATVR